MRAYDRAEYSCNRREPLSSLRVTGYWGTQVSRGAGSYHGHNELPVLEYRDGVLDAGHYNRAQGLLKREGEALRIPLPGLKSLDLILQRDAWVVVDRALNDIPVAAWTNFDVERRKALHTPVHCQLRLYHANGGITIKRVLEAMALLLGEQPGTLEETHKVSSLPGRE